MNLESVPTRGPIEEFWELARVHARLTQTVPVYFGPSALEVLAPPSWSFGGSPEAADALLGLVLDGTKTATSSAYAWYAADGRPDAEPMPEVGRLDIILDSAGHPRVLSTVTEVRVLRFDQVDADFARCEGEGDLSLAHWRAVHEEFFKAEGTWSPDMLVVCERFRVLHQS